MASSVLDLRPVSERPPQLLYSFEEAGAILSVSGRQMQILVRQGLIPSVRIGRLVRLSRSDLEAYVGTLRAERR